ncbi:MAG TPA: peptidylprolyl isomerase [Gemmatales bacterium]|nr:peptidylprolyl isomerase [Gemmatales bacterium]
MARGARVLFVLIALSATLLPAAALAQERLPDQPAAVVNGEAIPEAMVRRALKNVPPEHQAKARAEIIEFLVANTLVDQHVRSKITLTDDELNGRMKQVKEETARTGRTLEQLLKELELTEAEMRQQVAADMRWEKFVASQFTDAQLEEHFKKNPEAFNGSQVSARHILVAFPPDANAAAKQEKLSKITELRAAIVKRVDAQVAQLDPKLDNLAREQGRQRAQFDAFSEAAGKDSDCPSKRNGGDLGSFQRYGPMVEPFAAAAFSLQPGQMSEIVTTQYGYHLILVTGRTTGQPVAFDMVKDEVLDVLGEQLRDKLIAELKPKAKIEIK